MSQVLPVDEWPWTLMVNGISSLQPKACTFVFCQFTSNPRDAALLAIVSNMGTRSSSSSARRETSSAKSRSVKELWPNATPVEQDSTVLSINQSMPVGNQSRASTQPWRTPASILNHELWVPPVRTQLSELSYSTLKSLTILSGIPSLVRSSHNAGRLRESNAARRSTNAAKVGCLKSCLRCAILHKVAMRSHVEWPGVNLLCWGCLCDNNVGLILARMICANTLPGTESRVIPQLSLYNCYTPTWFLFLYTEGLTGTVEYILTREYLGWPLVKTAWSYGP